MSCGTKETGLTVKPQPPGSIKSEPQEWMEDIKKEPDDTSVLVKEDVYMKEEIEPVSVLKIDPKFENLSSIVTTKQQKMSNYSGDEDIEVKTEPEDFLEQIMVEPSDADSLDIQNQVDDSNCLDGDIQDSSQKHKRKIHRNNWKKNERKKKRNSGEGYVNSANKYVEGAAIGDLCQCPMKCLQTFSDEDKLKIFNHFWMLQDFNLQNSYLWGLIKTKEIKRRYTKKQESRRNVTFVYYVKVNGEDVKVCKKTFLSVHGLQNHRGRVENLQRHISKGSMPPADQRGRHHTRPNRIGDDGMMQGGDI